MMRRGSTPKLCFWCDRYVAAVISLFVNGHGWTSACADCDSVTQEAPALLARPR